MFIESNQICNKTIDKWFSFHPSRLFVVVKASILTFHCHLVNDYKKRKKKNYNFLNFELQRKKRDNPIPFVVVGSIVKREKIVTVFC